MLSESALLNDHRIGIDRFDRQPFSATGIPNRHGPLIAGRQIKEVVLEHRTGGTVAEANAIVAAALDIRNCAVYGLGNFIRKDGKQPGAPDRDIAVVGVLPKAIFGAGARRRAGLPGQDRD